MGHQCAVGRNGKGVLSSCAHDGAVHCPVGKTVPRGRCRRYCRIPADGVNAIAKHRAGSGGFHAGADGCRRRIGSEKTECRIAGDNLVLILQLAEMGAVAAGGRRKAPVWNTARLIGGDLHPILHIRHRLKCRRHGEMIVVECRASKGARQRLTAITRAGVIAERRGNHIGLRAGGNRRINTDAETGDSPRVSCIGGVVSPAPADFRDGLARTEREIVPKIFIVNRAVRWQPAGMIYGARAVVRLLKYQRTVDLRGRRHSDEQSER